MLSLTSCGSLFMTTSYNTSLVSVESPADAKIKYGETRIVNTIGENGISKYTYEDEFGIPSNTFRLVSECYGFIQAEFDTLYGNDINGLDDEINDNNRAINIILYLRKSTQQISRLFRLLYK